jgi:hypothetical protein
MSELTQAIYDCLPQNFDDNIVDDSYNEETAAKNYGVDVLKKFGLKNASYEEWIGSKHRPDFIWTDGDGIERIVGEFKAPWDDNHSPNEPRYKIEQGIDEAEVYNNVLKLKYILVCDGRYIHLSNEYSQQESTVELDLSDVFENPDDTAVEQTASQLKEWIAGIYGGEWNEEPSERDLSDQIVFDRFIESSRRALNDDLLPSIERAFQRLDRRYDEFQEQMAEIDERREEIHEQYRNHSINKQLYREAIDAVAEDIQYDYESHFRNPPKDVDKERCIDEVEAFREELLGLRNERTEVAKDYKWAQNWHEKWTNWLVLTGKDYEGASKKDRRKMRETFQLQTLNILYNRLLLIRIFEDIGIIGRVVSDGGINFFDEKVQLRYGNKYIEPLTTAEKQAEEVYRPLFRRDTPHDWYHYEEDVLKTLLRRFDNYNFSSINRDIFGEMYQRCLDKDKRKRLGSYFTPPTVIKFLLDYTGFRTEDRNIKDQDQVVLDPACGSGTFVRETVHRVLDALKAVGYDLTNNDDLKEAVEIVNEKIRGLDIDPFAVQLAQSNLLIRVLQERQGLSGANDTHIELDSFSIFESDSLLTQKSTASHHKERYYRAREVDPTHLSEIIDTKETDYELVMGNPPYVRSHNQDDTYTDQYKSLHPTFDQTHSNIFIAFIEQGLKWLDDGGQLAFVISNRLLVSKHAQDAMRYILDNATIDFIGDLTRTKLFGHDVDVFPVLIVLTKRSGTEYEDTRAENTTEVLKVYTKGDIEDNREWEYALDYGAADLLDWREEPTGYDFSTDFESEEYPSIENTDTYETYEVSQSRFTSGWGSWTDEITLNFQITDDLWAIIKKIEDPDNCIPLEELTQIGGTNQRNLPARGEEAQYFREFEVDADHSNAVPVISGGNIEPFYLGDAPTDVDEYVDLTAMEAEIEDEDASSRVSTNKFDVFQNESLILYPQTTPRLSFVVDVAGGPSRYYNDQAYFLVLTNDNGSTLDEFTNSSSATIEPHYVCGLLNSDLLDFYYKGYYEHLSYRHAPAVRCRSSYLYHVPIYVPSKEEKESVVEHSERLHKLTTDLKEHRMDKQRLLDSFIEDNRTVPLRTMVRTVVNEHSTNRLRTLNLERDEATVTLNSSFVVEMYSEQDAVELVEFLIDFWKEADYYDGGRLGEIELPKDLGEFREEYDRLCTEIERLENERTTEEETLNDEVYDLYGVTDNERKAIEEYLESFRTVIK